MMDECDRAFQEGAGCSDCKNYFECEQRLIDFLTGKWSPPKEESTNG